MYYTKADAEKATVLFFEGAGCVERGDVENCRIRTAFKNNEGKGIYLELIGIEVNAKSPDRYKKYKNAGFADCCHYTDKKLFKEKRERSNKEYEVEYYEYETIKDVEIGSNFEYSKQGILNFVNEKLNCSFTKIKILDSFDNYFVHRSDGGYNFIEDYTYNEEKAHAAREAFNNIDMEIRKKMGEKYSQISLVTVKDNHIKVRCYSSDEKMRSCGMDPNERIIRIEI